MTRVQAIKTFFESDGGRKVTMDEFKALTKEERAELSDACAKVLGVDITETTTNQIASA